MQANWNPWHGCTKISAGCLHCYMYRTDLKHGNNPADIHKTSDFDLPLKKKRDGTWKIPSGSLVWTCFTADFLHEKADCWRDDIWDMIRIRKDLFFFFITKRIHRFSECIPPDWKDGWDNIEIGCTMENQEMADFRMPFFINAPIKRKTIICEPLLENIDFSKWLEEDKKGHEQCLNSQQNNGTLIYRLVAGGESGLEARVCKYEWILSLRKQCVDAGIRFHFKQTGAHFEKDGRIYNIPRYLQHKQAYKAGANYNSNTLQTPIGWKPKDISDEKNIQLELF